jgi:hypothetical protein
VSKTIATHVRENSSMSTTLLLALELGKKTWKLGFAVDYSHIPHIVEIDGGDTQALLRAIENAREKLGLLPDAPVTSCHEAGRDGFWLHRFLSKRMSPAIGSPEEFLSMSGTKNPPPSVATSP